MAHELSPIICWFFRGFIISFFFWHLNEWPFVHLLSRTSTKCSSITSHSYCSNFNELTIFFFCNFHSSRKIDEKDRPHLNKLWHSTVQKISNFHSINVDFTRINYLTYSLIIRLASVVYKSIFSKWTKYQQITDDKVQIKGSHVWHHWQRVLPKTHYQCGHGKNSRDAKGHPSGCRVPVDKEWKPRDENNQHGGDVDFSQVKAQASNKHKTNAKIWEVA